MYLVRVQSASGRAMDIRVRAQSERAATRRALQDLPSDYRAIFVLPA